MKKVIIALCMMLTGAVASFAQEGRMAAGINLGVAPVIETGGPTNFGLGAKFQYNITDPIRVEADLEYWFKAKETSIFDVYANVHYLIPIVDKLKLYPLAGIGYANIHMSTPKIEIPNMPNIPGMPNISDLLGEAQDVLDDSANASRFLFNIGIGAEYDLTDNLTANFEFYYQYMKDCNRLPIKLGIAYKF